MKLLLPVLFFLSFITLDAQDNMNNEAPYAEIGTYPSDNNANGILCRLIDGLGYRLHWASHDLDELDQNFKYAGEGNRSIRETMEHISDLSRGILAFAKSEPMTRGISYDSLSFEEIRVQSLSNLKQASDIISSISEQELFEHKIIFKRGDQTREFELWHIINGQISDAIYHVGQIVALRRANGNPMSSKVSVFMGKNRE